jgi:hypothetical protein
MRLIRLTRSFPLSYILLLSKLRSSIPSFALSFSMESKHYSKMLRMEKKYLEIVDLVAYFDPLP